MKTLLHVLPRTLPFSVALIAPALAVWMAAAPSSASVIAVPVFVFGLIPVLDLVLGRTASLASTDPEAATAWRDWRFDLWLWAWVPVQLGMLALATWTYGHAATTGGVSAAWFLAAAVSCGLTTGIGINVAHELMHRKGRVERALAEVLMTTTTYTHFCVEHVLGHHKNVATPEDPASSRIGETLYAYLPRTLLGGLRSAWRIETARASRQGFAGTVRDRRVRYPLVLVAVYAAIAVVVGGWGVVFFAAQSIVAMLLLETINYIEHYGLARREIRPGVYERTLPHHSWNASERLTNWVLFHLERHADHHHIASRPYFALRHIEDSPQLPTGYAGMVLLSLVPPLWRRVMDPRVVAWQQRASSSSSMTASSSMTSSSSSSLLSPSSSALLAPAE
jgi:alkane 1-monooxygenase